MRNFLLIGILLIVSTFLVLSCKSPLSANSESSTTNETWSEVLDGIRFRIWTDKLSYQEGEDIWLYVVFENVGSQARVILVNAQQPQCPEEAPLYDLEKVIVIVTDDSGNGSSSTIEIVPIYSNMLHTVPDLLKLLPGQTHQERTRLNSRFWTDKKVFEHAPFEYVQFIPESGRYTLQAIYTWDELPHPSPERKKQLNQLGAPLWQGYLKSNQINITVTSKYQDKR